VAVGRLVEKKGFDVLVAACALLAAADTPIPCEIIGAGPLEADLRAQIEALGVDEWVTLRGPQPQHIVKAAVQEAAAFVAPCVVGSDGNRDGLPTVLLEAMALGTPAISTDVTGIPEILVHEQTGLMVAQHDASGLAVAMLRLVEDGNLRAQLAEAARARIEADFDIQRNAAQIRKLYRAAESWRTKSSPKQTRKRAQTQQSTLSDPVPDIVREPVGVHA
jgi:glycosyltransferase involved in cell wall biosynthesis